MERGHLVHSAIIRRSDIGGHFIRVRILPAVEPDVRFGPRTHYKNGNQARFTPSLQPFFENPLRGQSFIDWLDDGSPMQNMTWQRYNLPRRQRHRNQSVWIAGIFVPCWVRFHNARRFLAIGPDPAGANSCAAKTRVPTGRMSECGP